MMDDAICSMSDMDHLKEICTKHDLAKCHTCWHSEPNAGYDVPYCYKRTELGQGEGKASCSMDRRGYKIKKPAKPFKLRLGNIPKTCKFWKSRSREWRKLEDKRELEFAQRAIDELPTRLRKKLVLR